MPEGATKDTLVAPYNDLDSVQELVREHKDQVAAIIIEPFVGNGNFIRPTQAFIQGLRTLCDDEGILLVFDEVMTGFRVALSSAQESWVLNQTCPHSVRSWVEVCQ